MVQRWQERQRTLDEKLLWPACCAVANGNEIKAREAFFIYASLDRAWLALGEEELHRRICELRFPDAP